MSSPASSELSTGERIGRYTVLRRLATGGMAEVYLARQEGPKNFAKLVVLKRVLPGYAQTERFVEMFLDESRLAARLSHPNIAQTFELGEHEGRFHIAMEYVAGESLSRLVKRALSEGRPIPAGSVLRIGMQLLEALDYAHDLKGERGEWLKVVHRDVSPGNVIVTYHGGVKLLDFGIARAASHHHETQAGTVKGKGGYMSPEQATAAPIDQRTDVYAAGALLYLLTTGVGPFDDAGDVFAMMQAAVDARFPKPSARNKQLDPALEAIILKAMATKPEDRYATAAAMLEALESYASSKRLFPGPRELATFMRQLFPEAAELARSYDQAADAGVIAKLAESFVEVESHEIIGVPTRLARRPKLDELPVAEAAPALTPWTDSLPSRPGALTRLKPSSPPARSSRPLVVDEPTPLYAAPLKVDPHALGDGDERTMRVPSMAEGKSSGPVPSSPTAERATAEVASPYARDADERTLPVMDFTGPARDARTMSAEQSFTASNGGAPDQTDETVAAMRPQTRVAKDSLGSVSDIVSKNPWAFVAAGLIAVALGVLVLLLLGRE